MDAPNQTPDPSPAEIRLQCAEIRKGWSRRERIKRAAWAAEARRVVVPIVSATDARAAMSGDGKARE